jgi:creatinine amidohydrolase
LTTYWTAMTSEEFDKVDPETWVALLPVAAIEQHGPHLPVSVDVHINRGVVEAAVRRLARDAPIVILPMLPIGKSNEHQGFRGTLTLTAQTLISLWTEVAESVARAGFRKIVFLNSHGGQPQVVDIVARDLRVRLGMFAVTAQTWSFGLPDGLFSDGEVHFGIHAGEVETSMMMALRPEMVRRERLENFKSAAEDVERNYAFLKSEGSVGFGWMTQDLNPLGAAGDALKADAERGRLSIEHAGQGLAALLQEVSRYPLAALKPWPGKEISI